MQVLKKLCINCFVYVWQPKLLSDWYLSQNSCTSKQLFHLGFDIDNCLISRFFLLWVELSCLSKRKKSQAWNPSLENNNSDNSRPHTAQDPLSFLLMFFFSVITHYIDFLKLFFGFNFFNSSGISSLGWPFQFFRSSYGDVRYYINISRKGPQRYGGGYKVQTTVTYTFRKRKEIESTFKSNL